MMKINSNRITLSILLLAFTLVAYGQNATLYGKVSTDAGEPLGAATIALEGTSFGVTADQDGGYIYRAYPSWNLSGQGDFLGYLSISETITLEAGQSLEKNFSLREDALNLEAVVVSGTRYELDRVNNPVVVNVVDNKLSQCYPNPSQFRRA